MKKSLFAIVFLFAFALSQAQIVAVVDYMKVPQGADENYIAIEKEWKKLHQTAVNDKKMLSWLLYYVHNSGTGSTYNYVTVRLYENFASSMTGLTLDDVKKAFGKTYNDMIKKTYASRNLVSSEMYSRKMGLPSQQNSKFIVLNWMATEDVEKYLEAERKSIGVYQLTMNNGGMNDWTIWSRIYNEDNSFQAVKVTGFVSAEQMGAMNYSSSFEKLKTEKSANELFDMISLVNQTDNTRKIVKSQIWELLDIAVAPN